MLRPDRVKRKHILIVDDEESIRIMLEKKLFQQGFKVSSAGTGLHALQKLRSGTEFDLVICDLKMPGMSGIDLYAKVVEALGRKIPFLIITGFPERQKIVQAIQAGIDDVLLKPVKQQDLFDKIDAIIYGKDPLMEELKKVS